MRAAIGVPFARPDRPTAAARLRRGLAPVALGLLLLGGTGCAGEPAQPQTVVMVVVDTLRQDHLGLYGHERPTSPALDRFAERALVYGNAYAQAPWTTPSVASLLTGRYPSELGISKTPHGLGEDPVLLSEILRDAGWWTGSVISHYFLSRRWKFDQGFAYFDESNAKGHAAVTGADVTDQALDFVRGWTPEEKAFLFVHYFDPHYDYLDHEEYSFVADGYRGPVRSGMLYTDLLEIQAELGPADLDHLRALYDAEIAYTDHQIGRLLSGLREAGRFEDALIVVTADHGEEFLERGTIGHGGTLFNEVIEVPLLIKFPRHPRGARGLVVEEPVGLVDVAPTILDLVDIPPPPEMSGRSLLATPLWAEPAPAPVFGETDWGNLRSVVRGDLKLVRHLPSGKESLYDLSRDPGERVDLAPDAGTGPLASDLRRLRRELDRWMGTVERAREGHSVEITEEERRALRAIGYLD